MYAITGITGPVGGALAETLLAAQQPLRAVVRSTEKGQPWAARGCEVALAEMSDAAALAAAFRGATGVFILLPPIFDPSPGYPEAREVSAAVRAALEEARPARVVCLSTIGVQATQPNLLNQLSLLEQALGELSLPVAFLRAGWFLENSVWDVEPACETGVIPSFLRPLDKPVPMLATADVGRVAAELLQDTWSGKRVVELEGPVRVTPYDIAESFTRLLQRPVCTEKVPRAIWEGFFISQGMRNPTPRMQMLEGFNEGWIEFEGGPEGSQKGRTTLDTVIRQLLERKGRT